MDYKKAKELAEKEAEAFVGQPKAKCPMAKSCLRVVVYKHDTKEVLSGAKVQVSGTVAGKQGSATPIFQAKNTDGKGVAKFTPWDPGDYQLDVTLPSADGYEKPEITHQSVSKGKCPVCCIAVKPLPKLKVKVVQIGNHARVFNDALVKVVKAPQTHADGNTKVGIRDYGRTKSGDYVVQVTSLSEEDRKEFAVPKEKAEETLSAGDDKTIIIEVEKLNFVTPMIELEYKVVVLDRNLSQHQKNTEEKILPDPTYIQLSYRQSNSRFSYAKGGKVKFTGAGKVEVYLDEKCKKKVKGDPEAGLQLKSNEISTPSGIKLYLRGKTAGLFEVSFELDDPADEWIRLKDNPTKEPMGVVELKLKVHQYEAPDLEALKVDPDEAIIGKYHDNLKKLNLPDQKPLSDENKVKVGRFLHVQSDKNADRARVILEKLEASQWPAGTDEYDIVLNATDTNGSAEIYEKQFDETESSNKPLPVAFKVSALKAAEKELWAEGTGACNAWRGVKLDLGLDRAEGGLSKTPKRNGDWARVTVVQIKGVKVDYTPEVGKAVAWDPDQKRFYINFKKDSDGRKITIGAQLSEKLAGVTLHFMLAPDKDNLKKANWGFDFPSTWKWKDIPANKTFDNQSDEGLKHEDKTDRKNVIHLSAKTDANGYAKKELVLSRFGGDKFHPAAYIDQDPHLAKFVDGHRALEKRKPVFMKDHPLQVWRKVWYQVSRPSATIMPAADGFVASQRRVFIEPVLTEEKQMTAANFTVDPFRASWQFNTDGSETSKLCIGTHNVGDAIALFTPPTADTNPKFHVILCDEQYDAKDVKTKATKVVFTNLDQGPKTVKLKITGTENSYVTINDPPLVGGPLIDSANWKAQANESGTWRDKRQGTLPAANIEIVNSRGSKREIKVTRPATCPGSAGGCLCTGPPAELNLVNTAVFEKVKEWFVGLFQSPQPVERNRIELTLVLKAADGGYNGWAPHNSVADVVAGGRPDYAIHNTMGHELGHLFGKVRWKQQPGLPNHPKMYQKRGGSGTHCANNATFFPATAGEPPLNPAVNGELDAQGQGAGEWNDGDCIIFGYSRDFERYWCEHCAFDLLVSDLSKFRP